MSKLKAIHVVIIGVLVCIIIAASTYFLIVKKTQKDIADLQARYDAAQAVFVTKASMEARLARAKQNNQILQIKLEKYMRAKMPAISFADRAEGMIALWKEQSETLGPMIKTWPGRTGVRLTSSVTVPNPPVDPNAIDTSLIKIPIGSFAVTGDFATLMSHVRSWNKFNRLVQIDIGSLTGMSPVMTLNYTVTVLIFPRGDTGQTLPIAGAAAPAT